MSPEAVQICIALASIAGAGAAAWMGVKVAVAQLQTELKSANIEITRLRDWRHATSPRLSRIELKLGIDSD